MLGPLVSSGGAGRKLVRAADIFLLVRAADILLIVHIDDDAGSG